jgi:hypothetical protein
LDTEEGKETQDKEKENLFKKIGENFSSLQKETAIQVQEGFRTPNTQDQKRITPSCIIIKTLSGQNNERILNGIRQKQQVTCKDKPSRITADFSTKT